MNEPPWDQIAGAIGAVTGAPFSIENREDVSGGCVNRCYVVRGGGRAYFVKVNTPARRTMFEGEAEGLDEIARSGALHVPRPVAYGASREASWLVLEYIAPGKAAPNGMRELGRGLARMHRVTSERHGWRRDNTIGATPQVNTPEAEWTSFWRRWRLGYQLELAAKNGHRGRLQERGARLLEKLSSFFRSYTPLASLLHGDLWAGNAGFDAGGAPIVFDPAVYYGDREADLAMTELFGGFSEDFYSAYHAEHPLDAGYATRKHLYNLYHVLNHLNLFGGNYGAQAERMIEQLLAQG